MGDKLDNGFTIKQLIEWAAVAGAKAAIQELKEDEKKQRSAMRKRRLKNVKFLLGNYKVLKDASHKAVSEAKQVENDVDMEQLMQSLYYDENLTVGGIVRSASRTKIMVTHIEEMLKLYEAYCVSSSNESERRHYEVIKFMYLGDEERTAEEAAEHVGVEKRTVYRDVDAAIEKISTLMFGVDMIDD